MTQAKKEKERMERQNFHLGALNLGLGTVEVQCTKHQAITSDNVCLPRIKPFLRTKFVSSDSEWGDKLCQSN